MQPPVQTGDFLNTQAVALFLQRFGFGIYGRTVQAGLLIALYGSNGRFGTARLHLCKRITNANQRQSMNHQMESDTHFKS
jgi:hypothetical protein